MYNQTCIKTFHFLQRIVCHQNDLERAAVNSIFSEVCVHWLSRTVTFVLNFILTCCNLELSRFGISRIAAVLFHQDCIYNYYMIFKLGCDTRVVMQFHSYFAYQIVVISGVCFLFSCCCWLWRTIITFLWLCELFQNKIFISEPKTVPVLISDVITACWLFVSLCLCG